MIDDLVVVVNDEADDAIVASAVVTLNFAQIAHHAKDPHATFFNFIIKINLCNLVRCMQLDSRYMFLKIYTIVDIMSLAACGIIWLK